LIFAGKVGAGYTRAIAARPCGIVTTGGRSVAPDSHLIVGSETRLPVTPRAARFD
jgi:hypothetical protein